MASSAAVVRDQTASERRTSSPVWSGFLATTVNQLQSFYREPAALAFTIGQPFILLLILDAFHLTATLPNGQKVDYLDRLLPGVIAFSGMGVGLNSIMFPMSRYKERGTLRRIRATPMPTMSFLGGVILSRLIIAFAVTLVTYLSGTLVFGATVQGNPVLILLVAEFGASAFICIGLLLVALAKSEDDLPPLMLLILLPSMLFSGAFISRDGLPEWLKFITNGLPLTFLTNAIQDIANLGKGITAIEGDLLGLLVWGVVASAICARTFRMS